VRQSATINAVLELGKIVDSVTVNENASMLNSSTAEVSTRFDSRRLSELPISANRSVYNVLLSTPGVIQLATGQTTPAAGLSFSANGDDRSTTHARRPGHERPNLHRRRGRLNNPDAIQEVISSQSFRLNTVIMRRRS
jgi:hypothetical protein